MGHLPQLFALFVLIYAMVGSYVVQNDVWNSFIFAVLISLSIHTPYISQPLALEWSWVEALPWLFWLLLREKQEIVEYIDSHFEEDEEEDNLKVNKVLPNEQN